jgi:tRNA(Ile)-lysidine synthase
MAGYDRFWLGKEAVLPCPFPPLEGEYPLTVPGVTQIPGWIIEASVISSFEQGSDSAMTAYMDMDRVGQNLSVRTWKQGDRFQPLGMAFEKKLGEFMIDARIPGMWRHNIPVVVSDAGIVWLAGYRLDDRFKVTSETGRILRLEFNRV